MLTFVLVFLPLNSFQTSMVHSQKGILPSFLSTNKGAIQFIKLFRMKIESVGNEQVDQHTGNDRVIDECMAPLTIEVKTQNQWISGILSTLN